MKTQTLSNKLLLLLFGITMLASNISCKKINDLLTFTISVENDFTISSTTPLNLPIDILTPEVTTNSTQQFENNNSNASYVKDVKLKNLNLTITSPSGKTFAFLQSVHIYVSTTASDEIELAYLDNISSGSNSLSLIPTAASLDKYVKAPRYNLRTKIVTKQALSQSIEVNNLCQFEVTANIF